ncbi:putative Small nuclear ribonucleoprotein Sm D3 [Giardia muris]|uniref:Putative Small nuclear ribonucleoprotein Sm D3 n=1 Tax=Giardia muris TaxID=5742 RepID=A0A4Z1SSN8_GIAMU|nr:putative Small nuclear ribonucleoprotein Sm D3 [Giardia muris]|eukprot:TNJ28936.1 putative Small nuclear ribonucleoprotein Sm D3 [Giardia muris]
MTAHILTTVIARGLGRSVQVEVRSGEIYLGTLRSLDETFTLTLTTCTVTRVTGLKEDLPLVLLRGAEVRYIVFPSELSKGLVLKQSPAHFRSHHQSGPVARVKQ